MNFFWKVRVRLSRILDYLEKQVIHYAQVIFFNFFQKTNSSFAVFLEKFCHPSPWDNKIFVLTSFGFFEDVNASPSRKKSVWTYSNFNPLQQGVAYLYPLKTSEKATPGCNGLRRLLSLKSSSLFGISHSQMFFKIGVLKSFAMFTGKYVCWSLFLVKL